MITSTVEKMEKNEHLLENQDLLVSQRLSLTSLTVPARYKMVSFLPTELSALKTLAIKNLGHIPYEALKNVLIGLVRLEISGTAG